MSESMVQAQIRRLESHLAALREENERLKADNGRLREACEVFIKHTEGYNVDGSKRQIEDDDNCGRNYNEVISKAKAALEGKE